LNTYLNKARRFELNIEERGVVTKVISILESKKAEDITIIKISEVLPLADYFIIATIESYNQANSILFEIDKEMKKVGLQQINRKNKSEQDWILSDYNIFILHLFTKEKRDYYRIESLWGKYIIDINEFKNKN